MAFFKLSCHTYGLFFLHIVFNTHTHIYIYGERESERDGGRERGRQKCLPLSIYTYSDTENLLWCSSPQEGTWQRLTNDLFLGLWLIGKTFMIYMNLNEWWHDHLDISCTKQNKAPHKLFSLSKALKSRQTKISKVEGMREPIIISIKSSGVYKSCFGVCNISFHK